MEAYRASEEGSLGSKESPRYSHTILRELEKAKMNPIISKSRGGGEGELRNNGAAAIKA